MSTVIVYESKTGFTKQYAQWMAGELACKCVPLKAFLKEEISSYEQVIFGGWIMGGMIARLDKLRNVAAPAAVFAVGITPASEDVITKIQEQNKLAGIPFYYMEGGMRPDKLGFLPRTMLNIMKKSVAKKENRDSQEDFMVQMLGTSFDHTDKKQIEPLIKHLVIIA